MRQISLRLRCFVFLGALALGAPAQASGLWFANISLLASYQIIAGQNQCFIYTYDLNGNRLARSNLNPGATPTWGSSVFGCSNWLSS